MTASVFNYSSLQTSASPIPMAGTAGYLDAILYACLVTGFNSRTISSLTVTANVATVTTSTTHGYNVGDVILIAGANESVFNDSFSIASVPASNQYTFAVTTTTTPATGSLTCKIAPLGWTRSYTDTSKSVYRAPAGNQFYLRVDDTSAQYATVTAYESMTTVDAGTNSVGPVYWKKSNASSTATREWYLIGNTKTFYLTTAWDSNYPTLHMGYAFGDIKTLKSGDLYNTMLIGHNNSTPSNASYNQSWTYTNWDAAQTTGQYIIRSYTGVVGGVGFWKLSTAHQQMGVGGSFPLYDRVDNGIHLYPVEICEVGSYLRGRMPGIYVPLESSAGYFSSNDRTIVISGRTYMANKVAAYNVTPGNCWFDITGPWDY